MQTSPLPPLARTLPPLSTSTPKTLPSLGTRTTGDGGLNQQRIPNISEDLTGKTKKLKLIYKLKV